MFDINISFFPQQNFVVYKTFNKRQNITKSKPNLKKRLNSISNPVRRNELTCPSTKLKKKLFCRRQWSQNVRNVIKTVRDAIKPET